MPAPIYYNCVTFLPVLAPGMTNIVKSYDKSSREKKLQHLASNLLLQVGTQYLGYLSAMAWCGMSVTPISVGIGSVAIITGLFLMIHCFKHDPKLKEIVLKQTAHALANFALSFFLNFTLLKYAAPYGQASEKARAKGIEVAEEMTQRFKELVQSLPESATATRSILLEKWFDFSVRIDTSNKIMVDLGYTSWKNAKIILGPLLLAAVSYGNSLYATYTGQQAVAETPKARARA